MMTVKIEKECGCFKRADYLSAKTFENRDDALIYAQKLCVEMNETFCKKHCFSVAETDHNEMTIRVAIGD